MKLKILGSGSHGNCYILEGTNQSLLLECGVKWQDILKGLNFNVSNVSCLVSHEHKDHCRALKDIVKASIDVYSGKKTFEGIFTYPNETSPHIRQIEANKQASIGRFIVLPFSLEHDVPNMGFLIQHPEMGKLVYITDSYYCKYRFKGLNHIAIECNYSKALLDENLYSDKTVLPVRDRVVESHMSLETCKDFLMANDLSQVKDIVLMHLSDGNSDAEQFKREIEGLTGIPTYIAEPGLEIEL